MHINSTDSAVQYILPGFQVGFHLNDFILGRHNLCIDFCLFISYPLETCIGCIQISLYLLQFCAHIFNDLLPVFLFQTGRINLSLQVLHLVVQVIGIGRHGKCLSAQQNRNGQQGGHIC